MMDAAKTSQIRKSVTTVIVLVQGIVAHVLKDSKWFKVILWTILLGLFSYELSVRMIPNAARKLESRGFWGLDLNKHPAELIQLTRSGANGRETEAETIPRIPECMGVMTAFVYFVSLLSIFAILTDAEQSDQINYLSGAMAICFTTFLGFVDDALDLRWRYKIWLPYIAAIPLMCTYSGPTNIRIPRIIMDRVFGVSTKNLTFYEVHLGVWYLFYMSNLTALCSNAINIYAGLNGLEVGQALIINIFIIWHNTIELLQNRDGTHLISLIFALLFLNASAALYVYNAYPSQVFVGDVFTMLAGVHFASCAIMGHFAKTLLLFFIPQIINFLLSLPQILPIIFCPRHRIPLYDHKTGMLHNSGNYTLINVTLWLCGPMSERALVNLLLMLQVICGSIGLGIRYSQVYNVLFQ